MAYPRRIDPLNPAGSLGPPRLGQGVPGGIRRLQPSLINPLNPASSMNAARKPSQALEDKWERFKSYPRPMVADLISKKKVAALSTNFRDDSTGQFSEKDINDLRKMGVDKDMIPLLQEVVQGKREFGQSHAVHRSTLTAVSRGLGAIEATGAGFFSGTEEYQRKHHYQGKLLDYISHPSRIYKELGAGFSEVPHSVRTGKSYQDLLKETTDKNSIFHKWAMPIGLGMSVLFDPTTYMTFGATSASKTAAYHILAEADKATATHASKLIKANFGKTIQTIHGPIKANWKNFDEIHAAVKYEHGSPWTLGDALDQLKRQGLAQKDQIRRTKDFVNPKTGETMKATIRQRVGATVAPQNVLGGRGVRFAGKEIPGTPWLGQKLAGGTRGLGKEGSIVDDMGGILIPDWGARHVIADGQRASALVEGARIKSALQKAKTDVSRTVREMQRPLVEVADGEMDNVLHNLAPGEVKAFSGVQPKRVLVRPEARRGILTAADDTLDAAQLAVRNNIRKAVEDQIDMAVKSGVTKTSMNKLWKDLTEHYDDPLVALAEFKFKSTAQSLAKDWVKQIVNDPRFAFPLKPLESEAKAAAKKANPNVLDEIPTGYQEFIMGNERYAVSDGIIDAVKDLTDPVRLDISMRRGIRRLNMAQDFWKLYATSPNPAFHVMNFLGATWNNALAHVYNPGDYFDSLELLYRGRKEEAAQAGAKFGLTRRVPQSTEAGRQAQQILSEAEARSGLGRSSFLFGDVTQGNITPGQLAMSDKPMDEALMGPARQFAVEGLESGKSLLGRQLTPVGGFREAPTVTTVQVTQAAQHAEIPAPITLVHPAMIPDVTAPLDDAQRQTIGAVISRHTHGPGTALPPTEENMAYVRQLQEAIAPGGPASNLEEFTKALQGGKKHGIWGPGEKPENWDAFHDAVLADLERLTKEQKVQYIKPSFPDKPFKTPGELVEPGKYQPLYRPTAEQMQGEAKYFPVMIKNDDPTKIYVGRWDDTPGDVLGRWGVEHPDDMLTHREYTTAMGQFAPDGSIAVNAGDEALSKAATEKAEEVFARVSDKRVARLGPSIQDLAGDKPYLNYFRIYQDPKNPDHIIAGMPGDDHYEVLDELGLNPEEVKTWHQGTGVFDPDTGKIHQVNIVRTGNDEWDKAAEVPEDAAALSERALAAAREIYGETGAKTVSQVVPEQLVTKGKLRKGAIAKTYGISVPRKVAGTALLATGNPIGFVAFMPELARAGRRVSGTIEDMVRLAPFLKYSENKQIAAVLREVGPINSAMLGIDYHGFSKADQQVMYDIGAHISRQFQFDYSNLTNFERYIAKTIFPFWTYYKNNLALQVQQLVKNPKLFGVALKTMNYINENGENYNMGPWQEILPSYFENLQAFQVPVPNSVRKQLGLPPDMPLYLNPKMPFLSINLIPNVWDILRDPSKTTPQQLREIIAPVAGAVGPLAPLPLPGAKMLLEAGTGYNLGLNRPIDWRRVESGDTQEAYTEAPTFMKFLPDKLNKYFGMFEDPKTGKLMISQTGKYIVEQMTTPFINNLGSAIPGQGGTEEDVQRQKADLVSWLTGVRLIPVDVLRLNRNSAYTLLNALEAKQDRLETRGQTLNEKDMELLAMVRADLKAIEATWDMREADQEAKKNAP